MHVLRSSGSGRSRISELDRVTLNGLASLGKERGKVDDSIEKVVDTVKESSMARERIEDEFIKRSHQSKSSVEKADKEDEARQLAMERELIALLAVEENRPAAASLEFDSPQASSHPSAGKSAGIGKLIRTEGNTVRKFVSNRLSPKSKRVTDSEWDQENFENGELASTSTNDKSGSPRIADSTRYEGDVGGSPHIGHSVQMIDASLGQRVRWFSPKRKSSDSVVVENSDLTPKSKGGTAARLEGASSAKRSTGSESTN